MKDDYFHKLSPFIQEYIYKNNWTELREIQTEACRVIFDTNSHLLLSSGTASGKTEAAFLPALTQITEDPPVSVGILYIAPMKALINDQFYRLGDLLKETGIPVCCWHGDIPQSVKTKFLKEPAGVLQITPESLESMLINRNRDLVRIFGDLRFIIIDEVHAFMSSDRGIQILCQMERLQTYIRTKPRRIGLSATLGDYTAAERWLASGTDRATVTPHTAPMHQKVRLSLEHYPMPELETDKSPFEDPAWVYIYDKSLARKCIIFSNGREFADGVIANMKYMAAINNAPDIYHVHHGSISGPLREYAESEMKLNVEPVVIGATVTLEMGIDIGSLERVIQLGPPVSVSSLVQRLGRSGRRGNPPEMLFLDWEAFQGINPPFPYNMPWKTIQIIAMLQLYLEEKWIEPPRILKYPLSMLYHQIMSLITAAGELSPQTLFERIFNLSSFAGISKDDLRDMLTHLINKDHLQLTDENGIIIGLEGEKIVNSFKFYAVFPEEEEWAVSDGSTKIGMIESPVPMHEYITLAGKCWQVTGVDNEKKTVFVVHTKRKMRFFWTGDRAIVHNRILQRMKQVLFEDAEYPYLQTMARERLEFARMTAREHRLDEVNVCALGKGRFAIFPWMGHISYYTLSQIMRHDMLRRLNIRSIGGYAPYFLTVKYTEGGVEDLLAEFRKTAAADPDPDAFINVREIRQFKKLLEYKTPKFDRFVPDHLIKRQVTVDFMDVDFIKQQIDGWG